MNASMTVKFQESNFGDSFDVGELKRFLSLVGDMPTVDANVFLKPTFLRRLLNARPADVVEKTPEYLQDGIMTTDFIPSNIRAILWDNDGVLVDSENAFFEITRRVFQERGLALDSKFWATHFLGKGMKTSQIAQSLGMPVEESLRLAAHRDILWRQRIKDPVSLCSGVPATLKFLAGRYRMAVVTGAPREHFEDVHRSSGMMQYFQYSITADECPNVKPAPDAYLMTAAHLGLKPSECLVIEDSPRGVRAAISAGMPCVLIATALTDLSQCESATYIVNDVGEILSLPILASPAKESFHKQS
jgi:beta-phosphoglucomutase-like phosphatase (HAD superfamily)